MDNETCVFLNELEKAIDNALNGEKAAGGITLPPQDAEWEGLARKATRLFEKIDDGTVSSGDARQSAMPDWANGDGQPVFASNVDSLTGTLSRKSGLKLLKFLQEKPPGDETHCIAFIDVDGLETVNAKFGHSAGDEYLRAVAEVLKSSSRGSDTIIRYGGDEFMMLFTECPLDVANRVLGRMRSNLEELNAQLAKPYKMSFSYGVNVLERGREEAAESAADSMVINNPRKKKRAGKLTGDIMS